MARRLASKPPANDVYFLLWGGTYMVASDRVLSLNMDKYKYG